MRKELTDEVEAARIQFGPWRSNPGDLHGAYEMKGPVKGRKLVVISGGLLDPWEHVSVSIKGNRYTLPTWPELEFIKGCFWEAEEAVIQIHAPASQHRSLAEALHLWKPPYELELPAPMLVGTMEEQDAPAIARFMGKSEAFK